MFFAFAYWIAAKAPRERTVLQREPGELRIEEGIAWIRTRHVVPFDDIDGFGRQRPSRDCGCRRDGLITSVDQAIRRGGGRRRVRC